MSKVLIFLSKCRITGNTFQLLGDLDFYCAVLSLQSSHRFVPSLITCFTNNPNSNSLLFYSSLIWVPLQFASFEKAKEIEEFFASRSKLSMSRTLKQSIEQVQINAKWAQSVRNDRFSIWRTVTKT